MGAGEAAGRVNPKDAAGRAKPNMACAPEIPAYWWGAVHEDGARKYGAFNWRRAPVAASVYLEAARRHIDLIKAGQWADQSSLCPHAAHVMACMAILLDAYHHGTLIDDRGGDAVPLEKALGDIWDVRVRTGLAEEYPLGTRQDTSEQAR